ncbi:hypothetical protein IE53DRAFT_385510 [Violaceomyces palustris]|uniref:Uncharacterized protein n=1 Tax=Violaceomyces palustris TaxID=1673888 RepID=A0ACD0P236_9BASI|nr:hypothetical protein IE53DRAFT_385510 [Violaceomyces palustris]
MNVGNHCHLASCNSLSFLPISCQNCQEKFCESHYLPEHHQCTDPSPLAGSQRDVRPGETRLPCQKNGCNKPTLNVASTDSIRTSGGDTAGGIPFTHSGPRCERCGCSFCPLHRSPTSHGCTAKPPRTEGQLRMDAAAERKAKAKAILAKNFPKRQ